ncbi:MAG: type IV pilus assembly protein PilM [Candidatus Margulisbacteria bacterium]|jgi:type IV pilus assembly protein PilM|nr:type IV pilus assembly protein PilM [Candidatus Margulisiibacteriota bacterium]
MLGLDIGDKRIKIVELKEMPAGPTLTGYAISEVLIKMEGEDQSQALARTIATAVKAHRLEGKEVFSVISGPKVQTRRLSLPHMPPQELSQAVVWEAKNFISFPVENAVIDHYVLDKAPGQGDKLDVIVVAVEADTLKKHVATIEAAGLKCSGVTIPPFAILETVKLLPQVVKSDLVALIDWGERTASLNIFRNDLLLFTREITLAGADITGAIAKELALDLPAAENLKTNCGLPARDDLSQTCEGIALPVIREAMVTILTRLQNEIVSSFDYFREHFGDEKVARIFLSGGSSKLKNVEDHLSAELGTLVTVVDPTKVVRLDPGLDLAALNGDAPFLTLAIGAVLGREREINFLKIKEKKTNSPVNFVSQLLDRIQIPNASIIAALFLLAALLVGFNFYLNWTIEDTRKELSVKSLKLSQLVKYRDRKIAFQDITNKEIDVKQLLVRVDTLMPKSLSLAYFLFDNSKGEVEIAGESENPQPVSDFSKKLEDSPYFHKIRLIEIKKVGLVTTFRIGFQVN